LQKKKTSSKEAKKQSICYKITLNWKLTKLDSDAFLKVGYYINREFPINAWELQMEKDYLALVKGIFIVAKLKEEI
jgi:hypothetical protein